ncbi:hypothetical protein Tco_1274414 [Tanacetum coccineum]
MFGYQGVLLVPSFETAGLGPETDHLSPSYDLLKKGPFFTRSWASRNKIARSSILGPASLFASPHQLNTLLHRCSLPGSRMQWELKLPLLSCSPLHSCSLAGEMICDKSFVLGEGSLHFS